MDNLHRTFLLLMTLLAATPSAATVVMIGNFESNPVGSAFNEIAPAGVCTPGFSCLQQAYDTTNNIAVGAQTTVSSVIGVPFSEFHDGSHITDGFYGNGSSWIGATTNAFLEIDLGQMAVVEEVLFGRNRIGPCCEDRQAGSFKIEAAAEDHIFSEVLALTAVDYSGGQSVKVDFTAGTPELVNAQYLRLTFTNVGTAIDEVEVIGTVPAPATITLFGLALLFGAAHRRLNLRKR